MTVTPDHRFWCLLFVNNIICYTCCWSDHWTSAAASPYFPAITALSTTSILSSILYTCSANWVWSSLGSILSPMFIWFGASTSTVVVANLSPPAACLTKWLSWHQQIQNTTIPTFGVLFFINFMTVLFLLRPLCIPHLLWKIIQSWWMVVAHCH